MLPKLLVRLFQNNGTGDKLNPELLPDHANNHKKGGQDPIAIDGSQITTGTVSLQRLPDSVKERYSEVADNTALLKLTTASVQNGDKVKVKSTEVWYIVGDELKLGTMEAFVPLGSTTIINNDKPGYVNQSITAERLENPVDVILTGCNGKAEDWDGSTNLNIKITSIDKNLLVDSSVSKFPVVNKAAQFNIDASYLNHIIKVNTPSGLLTKNDDFFNGWNCYIKNVSISETFTLVGSGCNIDSQTNLEVQPQMTVLLVCDGNNFMTIGNRPVVSL